MGAEESAGLNITASRGEGWKPDRDINKDERGLIPRIPYPFEIIPYERIASCSRVEECHRCFDLPDCDLGQP